MSKQNKPNPIQRHHVRRGDGIAGVNLLDHFSLFVISRAGAFDLNNVFSPFPKCKDAFDYACDSNRHVLNTQVCACGAFDNIMARRRGFVVAYIGRTHQGRTNCPFLAATRWSLHQGFTVDLGIEELGFLSW